LRSEIQDLPSPDDASLNHSSIVLEELTKKINTNEGWINFSDYMQFILYEPSLGYYSSGTRKLGVGGDFTTAPEISNVFGRCLANCVIKILQDSPKQMILEIGGGSGQLAFDILTQLDNLGFIPDQYYILEISADLKDRQQRLLAKLPNNLLEKVIWLDSLPENLITGVILGNEVLDAMPCRRFRIQDEDVYEIGISFNNQRLIEQDKLADEVIKNSVHKIEKELNRKFANGFISEIRPDYRHWFSTISSSLVSGAIVFIDYGYSRGEYYSADRSTGTLVCHYQNTAHYDPLFLPGVQDLSAWVDFSLVANVGLENGFKVDTYTSHRDFLLSAGILELVDQISDQNQRFKINHALKQLLLPSQMGDTFKFMLLSKNCMIEESFMETRDFRYLL
jgi:SAM-dependent MidA family methyltransferase